MIIAFFCSVNGWIKFKYMKHFLDIALITLTAIFASCSLGEHSSHKLKSFQVHERLSDTPFKRVSSGELTGYVALPEKGGESLLLVIQGSGCDSVFSVNDTGGLNPSAGQDIVFALANNRYSVLIVDKPHVTLGDSGSNGGMENCSEAFRQEHSLNNWVEHIHAVLNMTKHGLPQISDSNIRIIGLSEGAIVAARVVSERDDVSHISFISGFGCNQIDDMLVVARRNWVLKNPKASPEELQEGVADAVLKATKNFERVFSNPTDTSIFIESQTPLFWSTFGMACPADDLAQSEANVFVAFGTADEQISAEGVDEIVARRLVNGKDTKVVRLVGGNHILKTKSEASPYENLIDVFNQSLDWMYR